MSGGNDAFCTDSTIVCIALFVLAMFFIIIGHYHPERVQKVLKGSFFEIPKSTVDYWSLSHLVLYACAGYLVPGKHFEFMILGAAFEAVEDYLASNENTILVDCVQKADTSWWCNKTSRGSAQNDGPHDTSTPPDTSESYWYSNSSDILVNMIGYTLGDWLTRF